MKATVSKNELIAMGFKPNQAKTILHDARQVMVKRGKTFWGNPRLQVAPRAIIEEAVLGVPLEEDDADGKD